MTTVIANDRRVAPPPLILIVDGNDIYATTLLQSLETEGYEVARVSDGETAVAWLAEHQPDLVIMDVILPKATGFEVLRRYRAMDGRATVLILSTRDQEIDKVQALRIGADDYVVKATGLVEILARVEAALRRVQRERLKLLTDTRQRISFDDVSVNVRTRTVTRGGVPVDLTPREFELLVYLLQHEGVIVTRDQLLHHVWNYSSGLTSRTVDQHMSRLRFKLENRPSAPIHFITVRKVGYRFAS